MLAFSPLRKRVRIADSGRFRYHLEKLRDIFVEQGDDGSILAAGIGSVFPRFTAIDFSRSHRAVPPSKVAYGIFSVVLTLTVLATALVVDDLALEVATFVLSTWLPIGLEVRSETLTWLS